MLPVVPAFAVYYDTNKWWPAASLERLEARTVRDGSDAGRVNRIWQGAGTLSVSTDGFVAGPNQSLENPLGEGGEDPDDWWSR